MPVCVHWIFSREHFCSFKRTTTDYPRTTRGHVQTNSSRPNKPYCVRRCSTRALVGSVLYAINGRRVMLSGHGPRDFSQVVPRHKIHSALNVLLNAPRDGSTSKRDTRRSVVRPAGYDQWTWDRCFPIFRCRQLNPVGHGSEFGDKSSFGNTRFPTGRFL